MDIHKKISKKIISAFVAVIFGFTVIIPPSYAQMIVLPPVGSMIVQSPAYVPVLLKGMTIDPENPLKFNFIVDSGNTDFSQNEVKAEGEKLVKYFLASMTVPEDDLWVNLSPYENNRIIPDELGKTSLGRDLLAQDYLLKQLTASLMYPEDELGKQFWDKIYTRAQEEFGTTDIPVDTFNKVWILPESATVYENGKTVYVVNSKLKVMLDSDYMALNGSKDSEINASMELGESVVREIIIPEIEKEVNEGKNFAPLRQIYHSLILAKWYKETIKESLLSKVYIDQNKTVGVELDDKTFKDDIYNQYMEAYKKGVYNIIKEDYDVLSQEVIPRKYFSGGFKNENIKLAKTVNMRMVQNSTVGENYDLAMMIEPQGKSAIDQVGDNVELDSKVLMMSEHNDYLKVIDSLIVSAETMIERDDTQFDYSEQIGWLDELYDLNVNSYIGKLQTENSPTELGYKLLWLIWNWKDQMAVQDVRVKLKNIGLNVLGNFVEKFMIIHDDLGIDPKTNLSRKWFYGSMQQKSLLFDQLPSEGEIKDILSAYYGFERGAIERLEMLQGGVMGTGSMKVSLKSLESEDGSETFVLKQASEDLFAAVMVVNYQRFLMTGNVPVPDIVSLESERTLSIDEERMFRERADVSLIMKDKIDKEKSIVQKNLVKIGSRYFYLEKFNDKGQALELSDFEQDIKGEHWRSIGKLMAQLHNYTFDNQDIFQNLGEKDEQTTISIASVKSDIVRLVELMKVFLNKDLPISSADRKYLHFQNDVEGMISLLSKWIDTGAYDKARVLTMHQDVNPGNILWSEDGLKVESLVDFERVRRASILEEFGNAILFSGTFDKKRMELLFESYQNEIKEEYRLTKEDLYSIVEMLRGKMLWRMALVFLVNRPIINFNESMIFDKLVNRYMPVFLEYFPNENGSYGKDNWWKEVVDRIAVTDSAMLDSEIIFIYPRLDSPLGDRVGARYNVAPPVSMSRTHSYLQEQGVTSHFIDLNTDLRPLEEILTEVVTDKTAIISMRFSDIIEQGEIDLVYNVNDYLNNNFSFANSRPFITAGGRIASFMTKELLKGISPIDFIIEKSSSFNLKHLLGKIDSQMTTDSKLEILQNSFGIVYKNQKGEVKNSIGTDMPEGDYHDVVGSYDPTVLDYDSYWDNPDNKEDFHFRDTNFVRPLLRHPFVFGTCPQGCVYCSATRFGQKPLTFIPKQKLKDIIQRTNGSKVVSQAQVIGGFDDDLLIRNWRETVPVITKYFENYHAFYFNTRAQMYNTLKQKDIDLLQKNAQWIFLLGMENPNERILKEMGKIPSSATKEKVEKYIRAPIKAKQDGFWPRTGLMMFWYTIQENELLQFIDVVADYINEGVQVVVYPYAQFRAGSLIYERYRNGEIDESNVSYQTLKTDEGETLKIPEFYLPENDVIKSIAAKTLDSQIQIDSVEMIKNQYSSEIAPVSSEALFTFLKTIAIWKNEPGRTISLESLEKVEQKLLNAVDVFMNKTNRQNKIHKLILDGVSGEDVIADVLTIFQTQDVKDHEALFEVLKWFINVGHNNEHQFVKKAIAFLEKSSVTIPKNVQDSIQIRDSIMSEASEPLNKSDKAMMGEYLNVAKEQKDSAMLRKVGETLEALHSEKLPEKNVFIFDYDGTLAKNRAPMNPKVVDAFVKLVNSGKDVRILSNGNIERLKEHLENSFDSKGIRLRDRLDSDRSVIIYEARGVNRFKMTIEGYEQQLGGSIRFEAEQAEQIKKDMAKIKEAFPKEVKDVEIRKPTIYASILIEMNNQEKIPEIWEFLNKQKTELGIIASGPSIDKKPIKGMINGRESEQLYFAWYLPTDKEKTINKNILNKYEVEELIYFGDSYGEGGSDNEILNVEDLDAVHIENPSDISELLNAFNSLIDEELAENDSAMLDSTEKAVGTIIWDYDQTIFKGAHESARDHQGQIVARILNGLDAGDKISSEAMSEGVKFFDDTQGISDRDRFEKAMNIALNERSIVSKHGVDYYFNEFTALQDEYIENNVEKWIANIDDYLVEGVLAQIDDFYRRGLTQHILTGNRYLNKALVDRLGIGKYFDLVVGAGTWAHQEKFTKEAAIERMVDMKSGYDVVVIGDGLAELKAAKSTESKRRKERFYTVGLITPENEESMNKFGPSMAFKDAKFPVSSDWTKQLNVSKNLELKSIEEAPFDIDNVTDYLLDLDGVIIDTITINRENASFIFAMIANGVKDAETYTPKGTDIVFGRSFYETRLGESTKNMIRELLETLSSEGKLQFGKNETVDSLHQYFVKLYSSRRNAVLKEMQVGTQQEVRDRFLIPGSLDFFKQKRALGARIRIVSASKKDERMPILEKMDIVREFDDIIFEASKDEKLDRIFSIIEEGSLTPEKVVFVDDAPNVIEGLRDRIENGSSPLQVVGMPFTSRHADKMGNKADHLIADLSGLNKYDHAMMTVKNISEPVISLIQQFSSYEEVGGLIEAGISDFYHWRNSVTQELRSALEVMSLIFGYESGPGMDLIDSLGSDIKNSKIREKDKEEVWVQLYNRHNYSTLTDEEDLSEVEYKIRSLLAEIENDGHGVKTRIKQYKSILDKMKNILSKLQKSNIEELHDISAHELFEKLMRFKDEFSAEFWDDNFDDLVGVNIEIDDTNMNEQQRIEALTKVIAQTENGLKQGSEITFSTLRKESRIPGYEAGNIYVHGFLNHKSFGDLPVKIQIRFKKALMHETAMRYSYKITGEWEYPEWITREEVESMRNIEDFRETIFDNFKSIANSIRIDKHFDVYDHVEPSNNRPFTALDDYSYKVRQLKNNVLHEERSDLAMITASPDQNITPEHEKFGLKHPIQNGKFAQFVRMDGEQVYIRDKYGEIVTIKVSADDIDVNEVFDHNLSFIDRMIKHYNEKEEFASEKNASEIMTIMEDVLASFKEHPLKIYSSNNLVDDLIGLVSVENNSIVIYKDDKSRQSIPPMNLFILLAQWANYIEPNKNIIKRIESYFDESSREFVSFQEGLLRLIGKDKLIEEHGAYYALLGFMNSDIVKHLFGYGTYDYRFNLNPNRMVRLKNGYDEQKTSFISKDNESAFPLIAKAVSIKDVDVDIPMIFEEQDFGGKLSNADSLRDLVSSLYENKIKILPSKSINSSDLNYPTGFRERNKAPLPKSIAQAPIIDVSFPDELIVLADKSQGIAHLGGLTFVRLGFIDERPVAVKTFLGKEEELPHYVSLIEETYHSLQVLDESGVGVKLHGVFRDEIGVNIVMDIMPGHKHNFKSINSNTFSELIDLKEMFKKEGLVIPSGEFEVNIDNDGHILIVDPDGLQVRESLAHYFPLWKYNKQSFASEREVFEVVKKLKTDEQDFNWFYRVVINYLENISYEQQLVGFKLIKERDPAAFDNLEYLVRNSEASEKAYLAVKEDKAMATEVGGIDMNDIKLEKKGDRVDIQFDDESLIEMLNGISLDAIEGFAPVTIGITPINNIMPLLGFADEEGGQELELSGLGPMDRNYELASSRM